MTWDAYMATLFGSEAWDFVLRVGSSQKDRSNSKHKSHEFFFFAKNNQDPTFILVTRIFYDFI